MAAAPSARARGPERERPGAAPASSRSRRACTHRARRPGRSISEGRSVGLLDEDERGPLHNGCAGPDERDVDVRDLAFAGPPRRLQRPLDDVPEPVDAPGAQAPAERVQRELTAQLDAPVLDEVERLAFLAEPVGLESVDHRGGEAVVDLRDVDVLRREARALPGEAGRAAAAFHVARQAADAPG